MSRIIVTGAAGFIGFHLSELLLEKGETVVGIDDLNDYYDVTLKQSRLDILERYENFIFYKIGIEDQKVMDIFSEHRPDFCVNLAAQAGVRYSLVNPYAYTRSNIDGFLRILEACREYPVKHLVYASSSSVYGSNISQPFSEKDSVDHPVSLYAATKKSNELMAHVYSSLYGIPTTGLRFFTVYGPYGRPDMALFLFTKAILEDRPIDVYNYGNMKRDFTYVDDIVESVSRIIYSAPEENPGRRMQDNPPDKSFAPYRVYNIGNNNPEQLLYFIECIEDALGKKAEKNLMEIQPGDVPETYADTDALYRDFDYRPATPLKIGIKKFIDWYIGYYKINI
ncbi:MAG: NAD-dependent epimerase [Candidatus Muiribacteriaceae bacterium]